jgi:hypothetical protein
MMAEVPDLAKLREQCNLYDDLLDEDEIGALLDYTEALQAALREAEHVISDLAPKHWWRDHPRRAAIDALLG